MEKSFMRRNKKTLPYLILKPFYDKRSYRAKMRLGMLHKNDQAMYFVQQTVT